MGSTFFDDDPIVSLLGRFDVDLAIIVVVRSTTRAVGRLRCMKFLVDHGNLIHTLTMFGPIDSFPSWCVCFIAT